MSEELPALFGPDTPARLKSVLLLWRHGAASREFDSQRIWILGRMRCGQGLFFVAQLNSAGGDGQNHHPYACEH